MITAQANKILLSVDQCSAFDFSGQFYTPVNEQPIPFSSFSEFVMKLEQQFNALQFPQSSTEIRSFSSKKVHAEEGEPPEIPLYTHDVLKKVAKGQFLIHVLFRQNTSWQGRIEWLEQKTAVDFRSVLELLYLLLGAVNSHVKPASDKVVCNLAAKV